MLNLNFVASTSGTRLINAVRNTDDAGADDGVYEIEGGAGHGAAALARGLAAALDCDSGVFDRCVQGRFIIDSLGVRHRRQLLLPRAAALLV